MPWPTKEVNSWTMFAELAARITLPNPHVIAYIMRGQADHSWSLTPSLNRYFPAGVSATQALAVEQYGHNDFTSQAHLHLPNELLPARVMGMSFMGEWWALMQHHNAPTRLLDWTLSPYVAAYYAAEQEINKDGAIYIAHVQTINKVFLDHYTDGKINNDNLKDPSVPAILMVWSPEKKSDRFVAQQGYFTFCANILGSHDELIESACSAAKTKEPKTLYFEKWIIPSKIKLEFLRKLRAMNIAAHSLFPGIDGLGRSIAESARLASKL